MNNYEILCTYESIIYCYLIIYLNITILNFLRKEILTQCVSKMDLYLLFNHKMYDGMFSTI